MNNTSIVSNKKSKCSVNKAYFIWKITLEKNNKRKVLRKTREAFDKPPKESPGEVEED